MTSSTRPSPEVAAVVTQSYPRLRRFFTNKVPPAEAHDLTQATLLTFLEKDVATMDDPRRFLFGIARNKLLQHFGRLRPGQPFDSQHYSVRRLSTTLGTRLDRSTRIIEGLQQLPLEQQMALELRYGEELKLTEVSEAMGKSVGQIKRYLRDGLAALRQDLGTTADDEALGNRLGTEYQKS
ncbi:MAG: sigma-70 family RNA polymerase sigma factor [Myxococcota bacterium]